MVAEAADRKERANIVSFYTGDWRRYQRDCRKDSVYARCIKPGFINLSGKVQPRNWATSRPNL